MKFINKTKNTVYLEDINSTIPYKNDEIQEIDLDKVKKSYSFRSLVKTGNFYIVECGNSELEKSLLKEQNNFSPEKIKISPKNNAIKEKIPEKSTFPPKNKIEVKISGQFYAAGGYSKVNRNLALGLFQQECNVNIDPVNKTFNQLTEEEIRSLSKINKSVSNNTIVIDSVIPSFSSCSNGKYKILYTTIEAYSIPEQFVDIANSYNEIWVTSDFCKEIFEKYKVQRPIYVIPDSVDTTIYKEEGSKFNFSPKLNSFIFLSVFAWNYRKGPDVLLKSYLQEFNKNDDVSLLIVSRFGHTPGKNSEIKNIIKEYSEKYNKNNAPHISHCSSVIPEKNMPDLYRACNAFALASRGEGFFLPACEASLCGLPVISTNCSGQTMFLNSDNSYLIDVDKISPLKEGTMDIHYWDNQLFPELKSDNTIRDFGKKMREVFENYSQAKDKNKKLQKFIKENYNIQTVSQLAKNRLKEIWDKI
jgi:glycosyltransferase involved in cell wall biosynthesis